MIPERIDVVRLILELNAKGWRDYKIELECGFAKGYIAALKARNVKNPKYATAAKLHNFHERITA